MKGHNRVRLWTGREDIYMGTPIITLDRKRERPYRNVIVQKSVSATPRQTSHSPDPARTLRKDMFLRVPPRLVDQLYKAFPELNRNKSFPFFTRTTVMEFLSRLDPRYWQSLLTYLERNDLTEDPSGRATLMATRILEVLDIRGAGEALALFRSVDNLAEGLRNRGAFLHTPLAAPARESA